MSHWDFQIEVRDDEIIVTLPGTNYTVTYYWPANSPQLLGKDFPVKDDSRAPMTQAEFLRLAWRAANDKARELGWMPAGGGSANVSLWHKADLNLRRVGVSFSSGT